MIICFNIKGAFPPVLFGSIESNSSLFPPLVRIFWADVNTAIPLGCGPNNHEQKKGSELVDFPAVNSP